MIRTIRTCCNLIRAGAVAGLFAGAHYVQAADVSTYFVRKGSIYEQSSAGAPVPSAFNPALFIARVDGTLTAIDDVTLSLQSDFFPEVSLDRFGDHFEFTVPGDQPSVDSFFPAGDFSFTFSPGATVAKLAFIAGNFPTAVPQVLNFNAAQDIDPAAGFTLNFSPFTDAAAGDSYELDILNSDGTTLFQKTGTTGTSVAIPAGTLTEGESYDARLRFVHNVAVNTTSIPGAIGSAGYFKETQFTISTTGSSTGGGDDTTPPTLVFTTPANNATDVAPNTSILFVFDEEMTPQQSITWSSNVTPGNFIYSWGTGNQILSATYAGGLPANSTVTWSLQGGATGFKDAAGNPLSAGFQGSFSTGSSTGGGTNDPCTSTNSPNSGLGGGALFKSLEFVQVGNTNPTPDPENPASAFASYSPATNQTVTAVHVTGPNGVDLTLSNLFNTYLAFQDFPSGALLESTLPAGAYTITATGAGAGTVNVPSATQVPVPKFNNLVQLSSFDPSKDFVLQFSPFTGAGQFDGIFISITAQNGRHFYAPDYCLNRALSNNATSVLIPANTFLAGDKLSGSISFSKLNVNTNAIPNTSLTAAASVTTSFDLTTTNNGSGLRWNPPVLNPNGSINFSASATNGTTLVVEKSTNLVTWAQVASVAATNGVINYSADTKSGRYAFFRARVQ